jgi:hypothetical protein
MLQRKFTWLVSRRKEGKGKDTEGEDDGKTLHMYT